VGGEGAVRGGVRVAVGSKAWCSGAGVVGLQGFAALACCAASCSGAHVFWRRALFLCDRVRRPGRGGAGHTRGGSARRRRRGAWATAGWAGRQKTQCAPPGGCGGEAQLGAGGHGFTAWRPPAPSAPRCYCPWPCAATRPATARTAKSAPERHEPAWLVRECEGVTSTTCDALRKKRHHTAPL
jgi:hypothetical protein